MITVATNAPNWPHIGKMARTLRTDQTRPDQIRAPAEEPERNGEKSTASSPSRYCPAYISGCYESRVEFARTPLIFATANKVRLSTVVQYGMEVCLRSNNKCPSSTGHLMNTTTAAARLQKSQPGALSWIGRWCPMIATIHVPVIGS